MDKKNFLKTYFQNLENLLKFSDNDIKNLILVSELMIEANKKKKKTLIFGNGGSVLLRVILVLM